MSFFLIAASVSPPLAGCGESKCLGIKNRSQKNLTGHGGEYCARLDGYGKISDEMQRAINHDPAKGNFPAFCERGIGFVLDLCGSEIMKGKEK